MSEIRRKLEEERQQLLGEAERVRQQRLKIQEEEQYMIDEARRKRSELQHKLNKERCVNLCLYIYVMMTLHLLLYVLLDGDITLRITRW